MSGRSISIPIKLAFGSGQMAESIKANSFELFLLFYYVQVLGLNPVWTGTAMLVALVVDAITDPLIGSISDNFESRWGRRHPFMYASAIPFGFCFYLLFAPPASLEGIGLAAWLTVFAVGIRVTITFFMVPYYAVGAELTEDYRDRTALVAYRTMFSFAGAIAISAIALQVFFQATPEYPQGQLNPAPYPLMGLTFGLAAALIILCSTAGTHNQISYLHRSGRDQRLSFLEYFGELSGLMRNKAFVAFFLVSLSIFVMLGLQKALALHMNTYFWALETQEIAILLYTFFGATIVTVPFVKYIIDRLDKKTTMNVGLWMLLLSLITPTTLRLIGLFPENDSNWLLPLLIAGQAGAGFGGGILAVSTGSIVADIADHHELRTGKRQEGLLFGFFTFVRRVGARPDRFPHRPGHRAGRY
jgi:Na+/melibiose symporter-like transporter